jgi:lon-related putative ATP-dependent protease
MAEKITELSPRQLRRTCDPELFDFGIAEDLLPPRQQGGEEISALLGQERALQAIDLGLSIEGYGFNIYALIPDSADRVSMIQSIIEKKAKEEPVPDDWCYVYNFEDKNKPEALRLPCGMGKQLHADMEWLVRELKQQIQQALSTEACEKEREKIIQQQLKEEETIYTRMSEKASEYNFILQQTQTGVGVVPTIDGEAMTQEQYLKLPYEEKQYLDEKASQLREELNGTMNNIEMIQRKIRKQLSDLEKKSVVSIVEDLTERLKENYANFPQVVKFFSNVQQDILTNISDFKEGDVSAPAGYQGQFAKQIPELAKEQRSEQIFTDRYLVNLIADRSSLQGAPVIFESNPTYRNLIGRIEYQNQFGMLTTNFRLIKPGALHQANGGYLVLEAESLFKNPYAYNVLKRALKNSSIKISDFNEEFSAISTVSLEPEPIPLKTKVILIGEQQIYYYLSEMDNEFRELFKVQADFNTTIEGTEENIKKYALYLATRCREECLRPLDKTGIARAVEYSFELTSDQTRLSTNFSGVIDLLRETEYWVKRRGGDTITKFDIQRAIDAKIYRSNRIEEELQKLIQNGTLFIDTDGEVVGQVNGLAVLSFGNYSFGKPTRIIARTFMGRKGVTNIEREVNMSGRIHSKGVMILSGYLGGKYAENRPISLSASLGFEQQYEEIEGDSASSAELYALLSSLSGFPINQGIAVTGSVNQRGDVQPIGGLMQKINGYFAVCKAKGFTGKQGVLIPKANVRNLMLGEEIIEAVKEGKFHIYPVETIDQGIEILTGKEAGYPLQDGTYPQGSVNSAVSARLEELAENWREYEKRDD